MKKKLLIALMMFVSFGLGVFITSSVYQMLDKQVLCRKTAVDPSKKEAILAEYAKIPNPFFENYYDGMDLLKAKNLYVKNNSGKEIDYSCFSEEDVYPWHNQVYLESKEGELSEIVCRK